jgi:hypothetical protein
MKWRISFKSRISGYYKIAWNKVIVEVEAPSMEEAVEKATARREVKYGSVVSKRLA